MLIGIVSDYHVTTELFLTFPMVFTFTIDNKDKPCSAHKMSVQIKTNDVMLLKETINPISTK